MVDGTLVIITTPNGAFGLEAAMGVRAIWGFPIRQAYPLP